MRVRILGLAAAALLSACEKQQDEIVFPPRPEGTPFFNNSSITQANFEAIGNLDRSRELTGIDFAMVMLDSIPANIEPDDYAVELFEAWRIGNETGGKGVLILIVEDLHTVKIEVGYELEAVFPDAFCGAYQETIRTYFAGKYFGDVVCRLILDMVERYQGNEVDPALLGEQARDRELLDTSFLSGGAGAIESRYFYDKARKIESILNVDPDVVARYAAADTPEETVERYLASMEAGVNYPFLGILTEGSHLMALEYPKTQFFLRKTAGKFRNAGPLKVFRSGDLAVARFVDQSVMPLLLRERPDGTWVIDVTKSWAYIQASGDLQEMYPLYRDHPWMFGFRDYTYVKSEIDIPEVRPFPENLETEIARLESAINLNPGDSGNYFELATLLYFECYWIRAAIDLVERGLDIEPDHVPARWLAIGMRYRFPIVEGIPPHFEALLDLTPDEKPVWTGYHHFCKTYSKDEVTIARLEQGYRDRFGRDL